MNIEGLGPKPYREMPSPDIIEAVVRNRRVTIETTIIEKFHGTYPAVIAIVTKINSNLAVWEIGHRHHNSSNQRSDKFQRASQLSDFSIEELGELAEVARDLQTYLNSFGYNADFSTGISLYGAALRQI